MHKATNKITLAELKQGNESVFKRIYEENRAKFLNFAKKYNLSDDENIDIYQEDCIEKT